MTLGKSLAFSGPWPGACLLTIPVPECVSGENMNLGDGHEPLNRCEDPFEQEGGLG